MVYYVADMTIPSTDTSYPQKPAWPVLFLIIVAGMALSILTERWIGEQVPPDCLIGDAIQRWVAPLNAYVSNRAGLGDGLIILYSIFGDAIVLVLIACAIAKASIRPVLPLLVFMLLRQTMQLLISFPVDPGLIWHYPGFPSLFLNYDISGDFYFSAYVGINILGALEMYQLFRKKWLMWLNFGGALVIALIDMVLRAHYTTDIYTSIITAIFAYLFTQPFVPPVDHLLKKLDRLSHFLLVFLICLGIAVIFTTQYFIGKKAIPSCGIEDMVQYWLLPVNHFLMGHAYVGNAFLIAMSFLWDCSQSWEIVQSNIATVAKICTYDRAGYGWSDLGPNPRTFEQMVRELKILLEKKGIHPPFIFVGHSLGGPISRYYQSQYPDDVAGMIFVDAIHKEMPVFSRTFRVVSQVFSFLSYFGVLRLLFRFCPSISANPQWTSSMQKTYTACHQAKTKAFATCLKEWDGYEASFRGLKANARSLATIPVTVISRDPNQPIRPRMSEEALHKNREELEKLKKQHLDESPHARFIVAERSGHVVQLDRPEVVIEEIRRMIDCVTKKA